MSESKGIIRAQHSKDRPYFSMSRDTAQDRSISLEARGMLAYLLSKPDNWQVIISDLCQECGKSRVYRIIKELMERGYMERIYQRDDKGKITSVDYTVFEVCNPLPANPFIENQEMANPFMANQPLHNKENTENRENKKENTRKRPISSNSKKKEKPYEDAPAAIREEIIKAWATALPMPPISSAYGDKNQQAARDIHCGGYTAAQVSAYVHSVYQEEWWKDKTIGLPKVAENLPNWVKVNIASPRPAAPVKPELPETDYVSPDQLLAAAQARRNGVPHHDQ